jgi:hypothetical protein
MHLQTQPNSSFGRILTQDRIIKDHHQSTGSEVRQDTFRATYQLAYGGVKVSEDLQNPLRIGRLRQAGETAQLRAQRHDLASVAFELLLARRDCQIRDLRRQGPAQSPEAVQLGGLLLHAGMQQFIPLGELLGLCLNRILVRFNPQQRSYASKQLRSVPGLNDEVVGPTFNRDRTFSSSSLAVIITTCNSREAGFSRSRLHTS